MRKIKEVLRLKYAHELSERQIARSCGISRSTVADYLMRARAAGLSWPVPGELDDTTMQTGHVFGSRSVHGLSTSSARASDCSFTP